MNQIIHGDNLEIMYSMEPCSVDLIYADPPFFTQRNFIEFNDQWIDIWSYIDWMVPRVKEMHRILKSTGSIYLHCDWHAVHYLKVEMDRIFGMENFQNEIVWCYSGGGQSKTAFPKKHDTILFYSKGNKWTFNYNDESLKVPYCRELSDKEVAVRGNKTYSWKGNPKGKMIEDWWTIPILNPVAKERTGYPTQKPEALLDRIIKASSNPGDIVFDPFCGCGTSAAVARKLNRQYIGIDNNLVAVKIAQNRLGNQLSKIFKREL